MTMTAVAHYLTWLEAMHAEAARLRHQEVEPEHMLLGLLAQGGTLQPSWLPTA